MTAENDLKTMKEEIINAGLTEEEYREGKVFFFSERNVRIKLLF